MELIVWRVPAQHIQVHRPRFLDGLFHRKMLVGRAGDWRRNPRTFRDDVCN